MHLTDHLNRFVAESEGYSWREREPGWFELNSGPWKQNDWRHDIAVLEPSRPVATGQAILYVTGGEPNEPDLDEAREIAERSGIPVALLFQIPNQPLFDLWEDDLIAYTFEQFIDTGDFEWPLLFPMARAAVRAMDALQANGFDRFIVTGASKRGWTSWLAGATGDPRVVGIAPMVIDNLNFPAQMAHQVESWGGFSEQIESYTSRGLQDEINSARGAELTVMMDPINYVDRVRCPILIVNGANDRYWTVDALSLYWDRLPATARCLIVPNVGHLLGDKRQMIETLSAFGLACVRSEVLPEVSVSLHYSSISAEGSTDIRIWIALSETLDFREAEWSVAATAASELWLSDRVPGISTALNVAAMAEARFEGQTGPYSLSTPVKVFRAGSSPFD